MSLTFVPGYLGTITIDANDYSVTGNVLGIDGAKTTPRKPTFGAKASAVISGQKEWSLNCSGHIAAEEPIAEILATFDKDVEVAFSVQVGDAAGPTDGGILDGSGILSSVNFAADAVGEWDWSLTLEVSGDLTHTPPTP